MKAFWPQMIDLDLFFRYLKGRCHGNRFCAKMGKIAYPLHLSLSLRNGMGYIVLRMSVLKAPLIALHRVKNGENRFSSF